nr:D-alanyl-D-alanine carboxypeptidase family protein [Geomicrobium halophilum]
MFVGWTTAPAQGQAPDVEAEGAILIDVESGKILYNDNIDTMLPMASMAKMMTEYLVNEAVEEGELNWDDEVMISQELADLSHNQQLSNVFLREDVPYTVQELYEAMAIYSANAATIALAEAVAGSETAFVERMNEKAAELGIEEYQFVNSTGLNNSDMQGNHPEGTPADGENMMTPRGTAQLAYHLIQEYPEVLDVTGTEQMLFREGDELDEITMRNWNEMLAGSGSPYAYEGVDGIKTGQTAAAGAAFTGTVEQDGTRLLSVVMRTADIEARFNETEKLYDYGFEAYSWEEVISEGEQNEEISELPVPNGKEQEVSIEAGSHLTMPILEDEQDLYTTSVTISEDVLDEDGALSAPLEAGEEIGYIELDYEGEHEKSYLTDNMEKSATVPIIASEDIDRANWFVLSMRGVGDFLSGLWG